MNRISMGLILCFAAVAVATAQDMPLDVKDDLRTGVGYFQKWDPVQDTLVLYRDIDNLQASAVRLVRPDGTGSVIYPMRDFPEARRISVWDATAAPDGGAVLSVIVSYGEPGTPQPVPVRSVILTYDTRGSLTRLWDVRPYHHFRLAADGSGNIYALGARDSTNPAYPMLIKYSPTGEVLWQLLPANTYGSGDRVVTDPSPNGKNQMSIYNGELFIFLAEPFEVWRYSLDGSRLSRLSVKPALDHLASSTPSFMRVEVTRAAIQADRLLLQIQLWPRDPHAKVKFAQVSMPSGGSEAQLLGSLSNSPSPGPLLGVTGAGEPIFLEQTTATTAVVRKR
jgi:hypothetical protein